MSIPESLRTFLQEGRNQQSHQYALGESSRSSRPSAAFSYRSLAENYDNNDNSSTNTSTLDQRTAKTLHKLVQRFIQADLDNPQDQTHFEVVYDKCARLLTR